MIQRDSLARQTLDTLPINIAVLDDEGTILFTNQAWRQFGDEEIAEGEMVGVNYFGGIDDTTDEHATKAEEGLMAVLEGEQELFKLEYPCHSPEQKQWFLMRAAQLPEEDDGSVVVAHIDITERKLAEIDARERKAELEHVMSRVDGLVQNVMESVLEADSRTELEEVVCRQLSAVDPFVTAWVGRENLRTESIDPSAGAGIATDGNSIPLTADDPTVIANRSGETQVVEDTSRVDLGEAHRQIIQWLDETETGTEPGYSLAAFPLAYGDTRYGVLTIYAAEPHAFDGREIAVIEVLASVCATAINAIEGRKILTADHVIELELGLTDEGPFFHDIAADLDCTMEYKGSLYREDATVSMLFLVTGADADAVTETARAHDFVEDVIVVNDTDEAAVIEFHVSDPPVIGDLAQRGVETTAITATGSETRLTLELPARADPRAVVEQLGETYPSVQLYGRQEQERPVQTKQDLVASVEDELTDRQRLALQKAFLGGFFDWPRDITGEELAESMEITPSTYHQHLRSAQRKVIAALFED
jgi:hypothetical protein